MYRSKIAEQRKRYREKMSSLKTIGLCFDEKRDETLAIDTKVKYILKVKPTF